MSVTVNKAAIEEAINEQIRIYEIKLQEQMILMGDIKKDTKDARAKGQIELVTTLRRDRAVCSAKMVMYMQAQSDIDSLLDVIYEA